MVLGKGLQLVSDSRVIHEQLEQSEAFPKFTLAGRLQRCSDLEKIIQTLNYPARFGCQSLPWTMLTGSRQKDSNLSKHMAEESNPRTKTSPEARG